MSSLLQTDQRAFRTCVLYEALHKEYEYSVYTRMKKLVPTLDNSAFKDLYTGFLEEKSHDDLDERAYRICILYEGLNERTVEEAFKNMKKVKPDVDFLDFDYWFYRFLNGNLDLDYDRSKDQKTRGFSDIPIDVVEKIVGKLGLVDKLSTRKVCRRLRTIIDEQRSKFDSISISFGKTTCELEFGRQKVEFSSDGNDNYFLKTDRKPARNTIRLKGDFLKMALKEFASVIGNPNWSLQYLEIHFDRSGFDDDEEPADAPKPMLLLNSLLSKHKIHVDHLKINALTLVPLATLLLNFQPNVLESLEFEYEDTEEDLLEIITETDQWKSIKTLKMCHICDDFPIENLFHARKFTVMQCDVTEERLEKIRDILFKSPTFESCCLMYGIKTEVGDDALEEHVDELKELVDSVMSAHKRAYSRRKLRYHIPDSNQYFKISCEREVDHVFVKIKRVRARIRV
ncbi:unnamed protein product [Caenorhabditis brenneri]